MTTVTSWVDTLQAVAPDLVAAWRGIEEGRCGEWLLFAGVHDLMHLEQLHDLIEGSR
jgi:hypothetical protein